MTRSRFTGTGSPAIMVLGGPRLSTAAASGPWKRRSPRRPIHRPRVIASDGNSYCRLCHAGSVHPVVAVEADVFAVDVDGGLITGGAWGTVLFRKPNGRKLDILYFIGRFVCHLAIIPQCNRLMDLWEEIHIFLNTNPAPGTGKRLEIGEVRYSMGMHRYYLERPVRVDTEFQARFEAIATKYNLRLDERERSNWVVFDQNNEYIGRVQDTRLILMPQKMKPELFYDLLHLYVS